jgi:hypothetical protein
MFDPSQKSAKPQSFHTPVDSRIEIVFALLNQHPEFARIGAECVFSRDEIASLLKISGDPWTAAMLAELANARWQAEALAESTNYDKVVSSLLGSVRSRDSTLRLMRRAVNRPIEAAMLQAQQLLARIQADKMPLTDAARQQMDENLLGLQNAWLLYSDRLLAAYMQLRDKPDMAANCLPDPAKKAEAAVQKSAPITVSLQQQPAADVQSAPPMRRHTDCMPTLH